MRKRKIGTHLDADLGKTVEEIFGEGYGGHWMDVDGGLKRRCMLDQWVTIRKGAPCTRLLRIHHREDPDRCVGTLMSSPDPIRNCGPPAISLENSPSSQIPEPF